MIQVLSLRRVTNLARAIFHPLPTDVYHLQFGRSLIVSAGAVIVNLGIYYLLKQAFGINYLISAPIGYCLGILFNYYLSVKWVFATRRVANKHHEFSIFVIINILGLGLYEALVWLVVDGLGWSALAAPIAANIVVFFWNFLARKKILY